MAQTGFHLKLITTIFPKFVHFQDVSGNDYGDNSVDKKDVDKLTSKDRNEVDTDDEAQVRILNITLASKDIIAGNGRILKVYIIIVCLYLS